MKKISKPATKKPTQKKAALKKPSLMSRPKTIQGRADLLPPTGATGPKYRASRAGGRAVSSGNGAHFGSGANETRTGTPG